MSELAIGVDIGGSGIKAAVVDVGRGEFVGDRVRVETPQPGKPTRVVEATVDVLGGLPDDLPLGIGFPSPFVHGVVTMAANLDPDWVGFDATAMFERALGRPVSMLNDADAAGLAEMSYGAGAGVKGVVVLLTLGTGIGSALFLDGRLVPNTEFGHLEMRGMEGEHWAAASVRERQRLSWAKWSERLSEYITALDRLIWPDLVILGGGVSRKAEKFVSRLEVRPAVVAAKLENRAGIIGAAMRASERA